jgi:hypothetical protein
MDFVHRPAQRAGVRHRDGDRGADRSAAAIVRRAHRPTTDPPDVTAAGRLRLEVVTASQPAADRWVAVTAG